MKYKLKKDGRYQCGVTVAGFSKGHVVEVRQHDTEYRKVLVDFGGGMIDWFGDLILKDLDAVESEPGEGNA